MDASRTLQSRFKKTQPRRRALVGSCPSREGTRVPADGRWQYGRLVQVQVKRLLRRPAGEARSSGACGGRRRGTGVDFHIAGSEQLLRCLVGAHSWAGCECGGCGAVKPQVAL